MENKELKRLIDKLFVKGFISGIFLLILGIFLGYGIGMVFSSTLLFKFGTFSFKESSVVFLVGMAIIMIIIAFSIWVDLNKIKGQGYKLLLYGTFIYFSYIGTEMFFPFTSFQNVFNAFVFYLFLIAVIYDGLYTYIKEFIRGDKKWQKLRKKKCL